MKATSTNPERVDRLFSTGEARLDRWYKLALPAQTWAAKPDKSSRATVETAFAELRQPESFFGYPGPRLLRAIEDEIAEGDGGDVARLVARINGALMSNSYRADAADWETTDEAADGTSALRLPPRLDSGETRRPYFELLIVSPAPPARWPGVTQDLRRLRRPEDQFIYESGTEVPTGRGVRVRILEHQPQDDLGFVLGNIAVGHEQRGRGGGRHVVLLLRVRVGGNQEGHQRRTARWPPSGRPVGRTLESTMSPREWQAVARVDRS